MKKKEHGYKGLIYTEEEPSFWTLRLGLLATAMSLMVVGLALRGVRTFGLLSGANLFELLATNTANTLGVIEAMTMTIGVSISTVVILFFWRGYFREVKRRVKKTYWHFDFEGIGLVFGAALEILNSYVSAHMARGLSLATLGAVENWILLVLAIGGVIVWIVDGKVLASAWKEFTPKHENWYKGFNKWRNALVAAEQKAEAERVAKETASDLRHQRRLDRQRQAAELAGLRHTVPARGGTAGTLPAVMTAKLEEHLAVIATLPEPITAAGVATALQVGTRQARTVVRRLTALGHLEDAGNYQYKKSNGHA